MADLKESKMGTDTISEYDRETLQYLSAAGAGPELVQRVRRALVERDRLAGALYRVRKLAEDWEDTANRTAAEKPYVPSGVRAELRAVLTAS